MSKDAYEQRLRAIHEALGGNGWAYANYGHDELHDCRDRLEAVAALFPDSSKDGLEVRWVEAQAVPLEPGDIVVFSFPEKIPVEQVQRFANDVERILPGQKKLFLSGSVRVGVLQQTESI